ncbi:MAG TPA: isocitrate/isopropylmalate dehydrogenase family protein [Candidatus Thalassarchaeaceae archaeon]|jgi:3-isopropylmalate dehydrogenase|nr:isocitrate/isopropylmalate dehydrogenase family protein [Candidatus Thalassarchaeaceae archaeon]DAC34560.1 MAG TPA: isocitrate/isopropylmalate dehydrogenase family protein [Candidatus Poseidoniales archaeon]HIH80368.1 isocitrate/isopropylmalate dehydrogenase family protein [Candidatus Thalassarchaeaceae archaeon]HJM30128.1 isocitrate/isopropylmalate dehydrogenase family protein [Candidatus Thalassarchaeaceae archaeon]
MSTYRLSVLPGDGTGREVMAEALRVLSVFEEHSPISFDITEIPCGGQHYLETGEEWPAGSFEHCRDNSDAILLGAIGWPGARLPNGDMAGGQTILGLRSGLNLFANVRPVKLYPGVQHKVHGVHKQVWVPELVDMVMVRENTEGLYHALLRRMEQRALGQKDEPIVIDEFPGLEGEVAWDPRPISRIGSERVIKFAFDLAQHRQRKSDSPQSVTCVDKSNVTRGCQLFRKIFREIASENTEIETKEAYIDAFTMWLVRNPEDLDVVVLPNMFGDIATDLASVLQGGMGMAASANLGPKHMLFEPVHGSAPKYAGKNVVNPVAMLQSVQLMFEALAYRAHDEDLDVCADILQMAIQEHFEENGCVTYDLGGDASTSDVGEAIAERCERMLREQFATA